MKFHWLTILLTLMSHSLWGAVYHVSPAGDDTNDGSAEMPFRTLRMALEKAEPGTCIYLREGVYKPTVEEIMLHGAEKVYDCVYSIDKDGTKDSPILLSGYPGEKAVIDLSDIITGNRIMGFYINADHWCLRGFDVVGIQVSQKGHTQSINLGLFGGSHCVIDRVNMHDGMGIGVYATRGSNNLVVNCDAYNNYDSVSEGGKGGNCDGFGFHLKSESDTGNVIRGCRAWRNSDDGFDLINNWAPVTIENCWSWENGYDADGNSRGDGVGFKSGGYGMKPTPKVPGSVPRNTVRNCISWNNKHAGFYANHHLGGLDFANNSSYGNRSNYNFVNRRSEREAVDVGGYGHRAISNLSYRPALEDAHCINLNEAECMLADNVFDAGISIEEADFESLDAAQLKGARGEDGSLPEISFLRLRPGSAAYRARVGYQFNEGGGTSGH